MVKKVEFECKVTKKARHSQQLNRRWCAHAEIAIYLKNFVERFWKIATKSLPLHHNSKVKDMKIKALVERTDNNFTQ